jgi:hypothetical protein
MLKSDLSKDLSIPVNSLVLKNTKTNVSYNNEEYLIDMYNNFNNENAEISSVNSCSSHNDNSFHNENNTEIGFRIKLIQVLLRTKSIGINFFFNYMNEINKFKFQETAPYFREASDGLNIVLYCENNNCVIYNQMFIHKLGKIII